MHLPHLGDDVRHLSQEKDRRPVTYPLPPRALGSLR
jgi:hypothetical protein